MKTFYFGWEIRSSYIGFQRFVAEKNGVTIRAIDYDTILEMIRLKEGVKHVK